MNTLNFKLTHGKMNMSLITFFHTCPLIGTTWYNYVISRGHFYPILPIWRKIGLPVYVNRFACNIVRFFTPIQDSCWHRLRLSTLQTRMVLATRRSGAAFSIRSTWCGWRLSMWKRRAVQNFGNMQVGIWGHSTKRSQLQMPYMNVVCGVQRLRYGTVLELGKTNKYITK